MKTTILKSMMAVLMALSSLSVYAYDVEIGGVYYNLISKEKIAEVTSGEYIGNVVIPESIKYDGVTYAVNSIGQGAFFGCNDLTSIYIPNSVTEIGTDAFYDCSRLTSVTIPSSVKTISELAFCNCSNLKSLTIPNGVKKIECGAFYGCSGLTSVKIGSSVTEIGSNAFEGCSNLSSVDIPNSVTSIGGEAFRDCSGLTSVSIPESVTEIGKGAFEGCNWIKKVIIKDVDTWCGITFQSETSNPLVYGHHLYRNESTEITNLVISNSVTSIGKYAFNSCSGLTSVTIPNSVTSIGGSAFKDCSNLTSATIPNSVTIISACAFQNCSGLKSVTISNGVKEIEWNAFAGCSGLTSVAIGNSVTKIGSYAFDGCSNLNSVDIPNGVMSIEAGSFNGCSGLTSVTIPESVTEIGNGAFQNCRGLTSLTIPESVTFIELYAFAGCSSLAFVTSRIKTPFELTEKTFGGVSSDGDACKLIIPPGTRNAYIQKGWTEDIFEGGIYEYVNTIEFPPGKFVVEYEKGTLQLDPTVSPIEVTCDQLIWTSSDASIATVSNTGVVTGKKSGTVMITCEGWNDKGQLISASCNMFVTNLIVDNIKFISPTEVLEYEQGFSNTLQLEPNTTPSGVKRDLLTWDSSDEDIATVSSDGLVTGKNFGTATITCSKYNAEGEKVSASCRVIVYKKGLVYVGNIFYDLKEKTAAHVTNCAGGQPYNLDKEREEYSGTVNIPETVTYDGVTYSVTAVGDYAFYHQKDLQAVVIPKSVLILNSHSFEKSKNLARVAFMSKDEALKSVGERAFYECEKLNNVVLPNSTQRIDHSAFRYCKSLSKITLSTSLNYINEYAFADCPVLDNVTLPESLKSIQIAAFNNDVALSSITFPASLEGIGASAFANCTDLKEVAFNTSHYNMTIGEDAFKGSNAISKVKVSHLDSWVSINFSNPDANPARISHRLYNNGNKEIVNAIIPEGPIYVNNNVFYECQYLKSVELPSTIQFVNDNIFYGCSALERVVSHALIPPMFIGTDNPSKMNAVFEKANLYVLEGTVSDYQSDDWWKRFGKAKIIDLTGIDQLTSDEESYCIYSIDGTPVETLQKGVNIIKYKNGTSKKVVVK